MDYFYWLILSADLELSLHKSSLKAEFYDRIINEPQEAVYQEVSDGMNLLKSESAVIQISEGSLKVY